MSDVMPSSNLGGWALILTRVNRIGAMANENKNSKIRATPVSTPNCWIKGESLNENEKNATAVVALL
ncbi:hypothetical protein LBMAG26_16650 [Bacteroidota bacterium]|nr:hypothetical protein LBMAG26_16650 [Bacteroidota bacterium]